MYKRQAVGLCITKSARRGKWHVWKFSYSGCEDNIRKFDKFNGQNKISPAGVCMGTPPISTFHHCDATVRVSAAVYIVTSTQGYMSFTNDLKLYNAVIPKYFEICRNITNWKRLFCIRSIHSSVNSPNLPWTPQASSRVGTIPRRYHIDVTDSSGGYRWRCAMT